MTLSTEPAHQRTTLGTVIGMNVATGKDFFTVQRFFAKTEEPYVEYLMANSDKAKWSARASDAATFSDVSIAVDVLIRHPGILDSFTDAPFDLDGTTHFGALTLESNVKAVSLMKLFGVNGRIDFGRGKTICVHGDTTEEVLLAISERLSK